MGFRDSFVGETLVDDLMIFLVFHDHLPGELLDALSEYVKSFGAFDQL